MAPLARISNPISRLWRWSQRNRAIGRYLRILPSRLYEDYGHCGPYTPGQVKTTVRRYKVSSPRYTEYAVVLFCDPIQLRHLQRENNQKSDYGALRSELGGAYFGGNVDFTPRDVASSSAEHGGVGHESGHSGEIGGHHGADGGGGHH